MGGNFSEPVPDILSSASSEFSVDGDEVGGGFGFVCMVLRSYDKLRILHAPPDVMEAVTRIVR